MKQRPYAVFDIDGTLIRWQLFHAITDALARLGYFEETTFGKLRAARMAWKRRDDKESFKVYEQQLVETYNRLLTELSVKQFEAAATAVFNEYKDQVYTYTRDLIKELKAKGYILFAISNSQAEIVDKIAQYWGFDDWIGADYEKKGDKFTGKITVHLNDKDKVLSELIAKHRVSQKGSIGVGDSQSDIPMLGAVEQPIAFNPDRRLFAFASSHNWQLVIERKNMIYHLKAADGKYILV